MADSEMWIEKYRPQSLDEIMAHEDIIKTLTRLVSDDNIPHLLFYGPAGTGKTSTMLAIARKMYGSQYRVMTLELNASDDRGIDVVRDKIKNFASSQVIFGKNRVKLIILDEADAMTSEAQAALRRLIEKYSKTTRFCLICNYLSKLIPAIQSRCTKFRFSPLDEVFVRQRLETILSLEKVDATSDGIDAVIKLGAGDMRKTVNILQATYLSFGTIIQQNVYLCTGHPLPSDIDKITTMLFNDSFKDCFDNLTHISKVKGLALIDIVTELHDILIPGKYSLANNVRIFILEQLADLEYRLTTSTNEDVQIRSLVGVFHLARDMINGNK